MSRLIKMCAMSRKWLICLVWLFPLSMMAQDSLVIERKQQSFPTQIPAGNYSGITYLGNEQYAVVSDKSDTDGFFLFQISLDSISGKMTGVSESIRWMEHGRVGNCRYLNCSSHVAQPMVSRP